MAFNSHVAQHRQAAGVSAGIAFGIRQGLLVDGDLTSLTAAKAAVDVDNAVLHISQRLFGQRVKASLDRADSYLASYTSGSDADAIYTIENVSPIRGLMLNY